MPATPDLANAFLVWMLPVAAKAALLLAAAGAATLAMRRASAAARYRVWLLALAGALLLPLAAALVPSWPVRLPLALRPAGEIALPAPQVPPAAAAAPAAPETRPAALATVPLAPEPRTQEAPPAPPAPDRAAPAAEEAAAGGARWAALAWLAGVLALAARRAAAAVALRRLERGAPPAGPSWQALLSRLAPRLALERPVRALFAGAAVPFTWGTVRPVIALPADAEEWPASRRESVLLHELAHVRRRDALALWVVQAACAFHWWNPLVWLAARRLRIEGERACDDLVLAAGRRASEYASDLLEIAHRSAGGGAFAPAALAMARRSQLEGRLLAILDPRLRRGAPGRTAAGLALLAGLAVVLPLAALRPLAWGEEVRIDDRGSAPRSRIAPLPPLPSRHPDRPGRTAAPAAAPERAARPGLAPLPAMAPLPGAGAAAPAAMPLPAAGPGVPAPAPLTGLCPSGEGSHMSWHENDDDGRKTWKASWTGAGCSLDLRAEGDFRFDGELTDLTSISPGGYFKVEVEKDGVPRRLEIRPGRDGGLVHTFSVDGEKRPYDAAARAWFATVLLELDRRTGFAVDIRLPALLRKGGPGAVLDEVSRMSGAYAKGVYLHELLDAARLDAPTMRRAIEQAGRELDSDYELARFLAKAAEKTPLADEASRASFLAALDHLDSDYEHARVLMVLVEKPGLSPALARSALRSAARLGSDYERSRVLVALAERRLVDEASQLAYLDAAAKLGSDYERGRSLRALIEAGALKPAAGAKLLQLVQGMGSAYEQANVLVAFAGSVPLDETLRSAYTATARGIGSDYERKRALGALPGSR